METIVGIDLGTTNSVVAVMKGDKPVVIPNTTGDNTTPSVVAFSAATRLVGKHAKNQAASNPTKTLASVKRVIGRRVMEIPDATKKVSYSLVGRPTDPVQILVDEKAYMPQQISALVLLELKKSAEAYLGHAVTEAVITVPAYFNDGQRQATKKAGELAGLNVRRIINEPTAAALAYGLDKLDQDKKIAVFDLGGGTFDISVLEIGNGVWEVKSTNGDTFLGGDDFDREIVNLLARNFLNNHGVDIREHPSAMQRLRDAAEVAKHELSFSFESKVSLPFLAADVGSDAHLEFMLTRAKFEEMLEPYLKKVENCCKQALKDAGLKPSDIDTVVMVGGSTRIPVVKDLARKIFGSEPDTSVNPDEVVALGAAVQGAILSGEQKGMVLVDVTPLSLGIETENEAMDVLIARNTAIPCVVKEIYTTTEDEQEEVDVFVYQGESNKVTRNRLLGQFVLDGIETAYSGDPQIEVRFAIDADGILQVCAKNLATGSEQNITIKDSSALSEEELKKIQTAAELDMTDPVEEEGEEGDDDLDEEDLYEAAEAILEETTEGLKEFSQALDPEIVTQLKTLKEELAEAMDNEQADKVEEKLGVLIELWDEIEGTLEEK